MSLIGDQIIEHGPWSEQDAAALLTLRVAQGTASREINALRNELIEARELSALFALQHGRMHEATELWRAEDPAGRKLVIPDLGALLAWLLERIDRLTVAAYPYSCLTCGNRFVKAAVAAECDADHRAHAARGKRTTGSSPREDG